MSGLLKLTLVEYRQTTEVWFDRYVIGLRVGRHYSDYNYDEDGGVGTVWTSATFDILESDLESRLLLDAVIERRCPPSILADRLEEVYGAEGLAGVLRNPELG